jgi:hypothetical protein
MEPACDSRGALRREPARKPTPPNLHTAFIDAAPAPPTIWHIRTERWIDPGHRLDRRDKRR